MNQVLTSYIKYDLIRKMSSSHAKNVMFSNSLSIATKHDWACPMITRFRDVMIHSPVSRKAACKVYQKCIN